MADHQAEKLTLRMWAELTGFVPDKEEVLDLVFAAEADLLKSRIPPSGPLARALEGAKTKDKVLFHPLEAEAELTILEVGSPRASSPVL